MASKSYWSNGKVNHKDGALIPEGRVRIDTAKSFVCTEGGLKGVLVASSLSGLSPNLTSRFTPGTLISSYEVFEALRRGVAVSMPDLFRVSRSVPTLFRPCTDQIDIIPRPYGP